MICEAIKMAAGIAVFLLVLGKDFENGPFLANAAENAMVTEVNDLDLAALSSTGISEKHLSADGLKKDLKEYGTYLLKDTLEYSEYQSAMDYAWTDVTENGKYKKQAFDLKKAYHTDEIYAFYREMSKIPGVWLAKIGESQQGRDILAIDFNVGDGNKEILLLTGSTHARETAGTTYITAQLVDIANKVADGDKETLELLKKVRIVAVPCTNPDGREGICFDTKRWTYSDGTLKKCTASGSDLNRNFCGLSWGVVGKGCTKTSYLSTKNSGLYYPGDYPMSTPEAKALEKFIYYFVGVKKAGLLLDYHQQGGVYYAGKPYQTDAGQKRCKALADYLAKKQGYSWTAETASYGKDGTGSTLTDYAVAVAAGAKFSQKYGFYVMEKDGKEYPLVALKNTGVALDGTKFAELNKSFATATFEIGIGRAYLGYSKEAREKIAKEYKARHFDTILYDVMRDCMAKNKKLSVKAISQLPEFPTGCESASTVMALRHAGIEVSLAEFVKKVPTVPTVEHYYEVLKKTGNVFDEYFVGDMKKETGKICYPPVIVKAANRFLKKSGKTAYDLTGSSPEKLYAYIDAGYPVVVWVTQDLKEPTAVQYYGYTRYKPGHTVLLTGYDRMTGKVYVNDPIAGKNVAWDMAQFEKMYKKIGEKAVIIK